MDPVATYLEAFEGLRRRKRWSTDTTVLRFAALTLGSAAPAWDQLEGAAEVLRLRAGWTGPLRSPIRYMVAAMILRRGLDPDRVHDQVEAVRAAFRQRRLRRSSVHETLAALVMVLHEAGARVPAARIERFQQLYHRWRQDHPWLTGVDDYAMAALHATRDEEVEGVGRRVEDIYQGLHSRGYGRGNQLQLASHLLGVAPWTAGACVDRFDAVARSLAEHLGKVRRSDYDEVAVLTLTTFPPSHLAREFGAIFARLREARPRPAKQVAVSLAAGLVLARDAARAQELGLVQAVSAARSVQVVLEAQQAALISACVTAAVVSTASHH